jgi:tripartite-type tricarboxylate transporter receptor subunit TctC
MQYSGYHVITPAVNRQPLGWEPKDFQPVANVLSAPQVFVVRSACRSGRWPS